MSIRSPAPFTMEYSPFVSQDGREIPSFRIYDASGETVAETDSGKETATQEADARAARRRARPAHGTGIGARGSERGTALYRAGGAVRQLCHRLGL